MRLSPTARGAVLLAGALAALTVACTESSQRLQTSYLGEANGGIATTDRRSP